jgi:hypothetical protein
VIRCAVDCGGEVFDAPVVLRGKGDRQLPAPYSFPWTVPGTAIPPVPRGGRGEVEGGSVTSLADDTGAPGQVLIKEWGPLDEGFFGFWHHLALTLRFSRHFSSSSTKPDAVLPRPPPPTRLLGRPTGGPAEA